MLQPPRFRCKLGETNGFSYSYTPAWVYKMVVREEEQQFSLLKSVEKMGSIQTPGTRWALPVSLDGVITPLSRMRKPDVTH